MKLSRRLKQRDSSGRGPSGLLGCVDEGLRRAARSGSIEAKSGSFPKVHTTSGALRMLSGLEHKGFKLLESGDGIHALRSELSEAPKDFRTHPGTSSVVPQTQHELSPMPDDVMGRLGYLCLAPELRHFASESLLFFDTETTGLGTTSAGTYAFLVGFGFFERGRFVTEQYLLTTPWYEEPALLERVAAHMARKEVLVSFNGKRYDWTLVRTRCRVHGVELLPPKLHVDLLDASRRLLGPRLQRLSLVALEQTVLGLHREEDVSGADIPALFSAAVVSGDVSALASVVVHNRMDLVAMALLAPALVSCAQSVDKLRAVEIYLRQARADLEAQLRAEQLLHEVLAPQNHDESARLMALHLFAELERLRGNAERERSWLERALREGPAGQAPIHLRLAKIAEHRDKDLGVALHHAYLSACAELPEAHSRRLARLIRKRNRRASLRLPERAVAQK